MTKYLGAVLAAVSVVALLVVYALFLFRVIGPIDADMTIRVIVGIVVVAVAAGVIGALISRIRELRKGLEDDVGKY